MSYNPVIASARRAAKQLARKTGAPYQSTLDDVARRVGLADWNAYLAAPVEIPTDDDSDDSYVNGPEHAANMRNIGTVGISTMPSLLVLPLAMGRSYAESLVMIGFAMAMWFMGTIMFSMFTDAMAVHPAIPDPGRNGTRGDGPHTSRDLATSALMISAIELAVGVVTRGNPEANFGLVLAFGAAGAALSTAVLFMPAGLSRRIVVLVAMNFVIAGGLVSYAGLGMR